VVQVIEEVEGHRLEMFTEPVTECGWAGCFQLKGGGNKVFIYGHFGIESAVSSGLLQIKVKLIGKNERTSLNSVETNRSHTHEQFLWRDTASAMIK
jgi:hypothetical protein